MLRINYTIINEIGDVVTVEQDASGTWRMEVNDQLVATAPASREAEIVTRAKLDALHRERHALEELAIQGLASKSEGRRIFDVNRALDQVSADYIATLPTWRH